MMLPAPPTRRFHSGASYARAAIGALLLLGVTMALLLPAAASAGPVLAAPLPQPIDISCQGYERDTVVVYWGDPATDETNYRVERSIGGAAFAEVATIAPDAVGNYAAYRDTGADVSVQNRRYRVRSFRTGDSSFSPYSAICNNRRIFENTNFRIFYGLRSTSDDCPTVSGQQVCLTNTGSPNVFVSQSADALQGSVDAFTRVGFTRNAGAPPGALDKIPINVVWCDGGGCAGGGGLGLSPLLLETPFNTTTRVGDPVSWIVSLHEAFHFQQFKYWGLNDPADGWVVEGQARSIQDKICVGANRSSCQAFDDIATGYAGYVPEVMGYLGAPNRPINQTDYQAALFWTYLTEKYGTSMTSDTVEGGMNLMVRFWEDSAATPGRDGIAVLNSTLAGMGHSQRFRDIWKDFAVANYAKNLSGPGVQAKYRYADMSQPGGNYGPVAMALSQNLSLGASFVDSDESVTRWGAQYYEVRPAGNVPLIAIKFTQDSTAPLYYTILGIKGTNVAYEYNIEARHLDRTLINDGYDKVVVVVAGLENLANYRYSFNGTQPTLKILSPTTANQARVGDPAAPDKFRVAVEVLAGDGTPLAGVNLASFNFRVGAQDVPAGNVLTSATIMGQHWFVLRAPTQPSAGAYDLQVRYSTILTGTQAQAVNYIPRSDANSMLVIDRSGSMAGAGKLTAAQAAARLYVDSWRNGDKIGVVSFNESVSTDMGLTNWTDSGPPSGGGSRQTAFSAINGMTAIGGTAIGDGLRRGWNELIAAGVNTSDWALILLSDGMETSGTEPLQTVINALTGTTGKRPVVHTVAVGPDADRPRMQQVANDTGGTYQYVSAPSTAIASSSLATIASLPLNMDARYRAIATAVLGQQQFFNFVGPDLATPMGTDAILIGVESGASELILSLSWDPSATDRSIALIKLLDPANNVVGVFQQDTRHRIWRVPTPAGGVWKLELESTVKGQVELPDYLVQGTLRSDVTLDAYLTTPPAERLPGAPIGIVASLTDTGPIAGANVKANVTIPSGATIVVPLRDDGAHDDGAANDGLYGGVFTHTGEGGSYDVLISATGNSTLSGPFTRQALLSFHITSVADCDQDGIPDEWALRYKFDPCKLAGGDDPDNDGLVNRDEWAQGTNPRDPDTDDGGEGDGSEVRRQANPLDPTDDKIRPTWTVVHAQNNRVKIRFPWDQSYDLVHIYRSIGPAGPFTLLTQDIDGDGEFIDATAANGTTYCYIVAAEDSTTSSTAAASDPSCATPQSDPRPPHGSVIVNDGANRSGIPQVRLTLWATDAPDPETERPGESADPAESISGVTDMMISNFADMRGGVWEPYATTKDWQLADDGGVQAVFVRFRDAAGNESTPVAATIHVNERIFLPLMMR